jgi:hypothetical protein
MGPGRRLLIVPSHHQREGDRGAACRFGRGVETVLCQQQSLSLLALFNSCSFRWPTDCADFLDGDVLRIIGLFAERSGEALVRTPGKMIKKQVHFGKFACENEVLHPFLATLLRDFAAGCHITLSP